MIRLVQGSYKEGLFCVFWNSQVNFGYLIFQRCLMNFHIIPGATGGLCHSACINCLFYDMHWFLSMIFNALYYFDSFVCISWHSKLIPMPSQGNKAGCHSIWIYCWYEDVSMVTTAIWMTVLTEFYFFRKRQLLDIHSLFLFLFSFLWFGT